MGDHEHQEALVRPDHRGWAHGPTFLRLNDFRFDGPRGGRRTRAGHLARPFLRAFGSKPSPGLR